MDPLTIAVQALAAGAVAGLKPTAEQIVKDSYHAVKAYLQRRFSSVQLEQLERQPDSADKQAELAATLKATGAIADDEFVRRIRELVAIVAEHDASAAASIGVDIADIRARGLMIVDVSAGGTGVRIHGSEFQENVEIRGVRAGGNNAPN
jgi:hypothetical protein